MLEFMFVLVFPLVMIGLFVIIIITGLSNRNPELKIMTLDDFIRDWLNDHGQANKVEEQLKKMKKDPSGALYMPLTYKGAKIFIKWGLTANKVSFMNLILSFLTFYWVIMASQGQNLNLLSEQPFYGFWFFPISVLVIFTGLIDGIDGAIARLSSKKSRAGGWLDNVIDRMSDTLLLICIIPFGMTVIIDYGIDFTWMVWLNVFLIFLYEYMRARHEGLGLHETKPYVGERPTRLIITSNFFAIYGFSSLVVLITYLINPSGATIWEASHYFVTTWMMLIFQITLLVIMVVSSIQLAIYSWKNLKILDRSSENK